MKYTLVWKILADRQLESLYTNASDKQAIQQATDMIEKRLKRLPHSGTLGSRSGLYEIDSGPLRVLYRVSDDDCLVTVLGIRRIV